MRSSGLQPRPHQQGDASIRAPPCQGPSGHHSQAIQQFQLKTRCSIWSNVSLILPECLGGPDQVISHMIRRPDVPHPLADEGRPGGGKEVPLLPLRPQSLLEELERPPRPSQHGSCAGAVSECAGRYGGPREALPAPGLREEQACTPEAVHPPASQSVSAAASAGPAMEGPGQRVGRAPQPPRGQGVGVGPTRWLCS